MNSLPADLSPVRPPQLSADEIERLATMDPSTGMAKGRLRSLLQRAAASSDPAQPLIEALLAVPVREQPAAPYMNPARVTITPSTAKDKRPLTPVDLEWLRRLPTDPAAVSPADVTALALMVHQAANMSDLRLLSSHFEPIWNHYDVEEHRHERRIRRGEAEAVKGVRTRAIERLAVDAMAVHVQSEFPELREHEARARAAERMRDRWADADLGLQAQIDANPTGETPAPRPMPGIEGLGDFAAGAERAQRNRADRETALDPFVRLQMDAG